MIIDNKRKFVFVHIPKTAGSSMYAVLETPDAHMIPAHRPVRVIDTAGLFAFSFVRNPFERLLSFYHYVLQTPWLGKERYNMDKYRDIGFKRFLLEEEFRMPFTGMDGLPPVQKLPQAYWVMDEEANIAVDFIGRFENLVDDFKHVCDQIGLSVELPHVAKSKHGDWREEYDDEMIQFVHHHHCIDFETFGY